MVLETQKCRFLSVVQIHSIRDEISLSDPQPLMRSDENAKHGRGERYRQGEAFTGLLLSQDGRERGRQRRELMDKMLFYTFIKA